MRGCHVRSGCRQSMPSSSIENCAALSETLPLSACGQTKRPRSRRLVNRHMPSPSLHSNFTRSPRRPRNAKTWPLNGSSRQRHLHLRRQRVDAAAHVRHASGKPHPGPSARADHALWRSARKTLLSIASSTVPRSRNRAPAISTSMTPGRRASVDGSADRRGWLCGRWRGGLRNHAHRQQCRGGRRGRRHRLDVLTSPLEQ